MVGLGFQMPTGRQRRDWTTGRCVRVSANQVGWEQPLYGTEGGIRALERSCGRRYHFHKGWKAASNTTTWRAAPGEVLKGCVGGLSKASCRSGMPRSSDQAWKNVQNKNPKVSRKQL